MAYVVCNIDEGLRASEVTVEIKDSDGRSEFLRVDRDYVKSFEAQYFLPVGVIYRTDEQVLIELPHEADSGTNRLWVPQSSLREAPPKRAAALA